MKPLSATLSQTSRPAWPPPNDQIQAAPSTLDAVDDQTLLCLILKRLLGGADAPLVAAGLLDRFGGLGDTLSADGPELGRVPGVSPALIQDLKVIRQLSIRLARTGACRRPVVTSFEALRAYAITALAHLPREQFRALYLDRRNNLLVWETVCDGTVDHAPVYVVRVIDCYLALTAGRDQRVIIVSRRNSPQRAGGRKAESFCDTEGSPMRPPLPKCSACALTHLNRGLAIRHRSPQGPPQSRARGPATVVRSGRRLDARCSGCGQDVFGP